MQILLTARFYMMGYLYNCLALANRAVTKTVVARKVVARKVVTKNKNKIYSSGVSSIRFKGFKTSVLVFLFASVFSLLANAQTQFDILSNNENLEEEYYDELDKWMLRAYEGDRDAQFRVGVLFASDQFDRANAEQAVYWYKQAARQGHILAQYNLGHHLLTGNGVEKNELEAIQWWKEAAKEDHSLAQFNVGRAYYLGIGVDEDHAQSRYWFSRAAQNNETKSIEVLEKLGWGRDLSAISEVDSNQDSSFIESQRNPKTSVTSPPQTKTVGVASDNSINVTETVEAVNSNPGNDNSSNQGSDFNTIRAVPISNPIEPTPVALYTNPSIRSVLISIIDARDSLEVVETNKEWVTVRSPAGFPIWVHSDYLKFESNKAIVDGSNVNARSVPITSKGTIVGTLNSGQELEVIDKQKEWYRLISPSSFKAWVKTEDYNRPALVKNVSATEAGNEKQAETTSQSLTPAIEQQSAATESAAQENEYITTEPVSNQNNDIIQTVINDNNWLFSQAKDDYTLQLASFDQQEKIDLFLANNSFSDESDLHRFTSISSKDIVWTYFLYGTYSSRDIAEKAKTEINQKRAWARSFGRLQENRCLSWKTQLPTPAELNQYCVE